MAEKQKTIADIVREMRDRAITKIGERTITERNFVPQETCESWADRIEAAAERDARIREDEATESAFKRGEEIHAQHCANCAARKPGNAAALREALERILDIEGYGAPWIEAKCIAQKALEGEQCTPPIVKETAKIEQPGNAIAKNPPNFYQPGNAAAMRAALEDIRERLVASVHDGTIDPHEALGIVEAALAAPARNCDRFGDELDAQLAFLNEEWLISVDRGSMLESDRFENWTDHMRSAYAKWLMATAKGGVE